MAAKTPTIAVLGSTGDGKSSLCNVLSGMSPGATHFPVGNGTEGETYATTHKVVKWLGGDRQIRLVDTPGLDDPAGNDNKHIKQLAEALMGIEEVDAFLIVLNGTKPRFDQSLQLVLEIFKTMFGGHFMKNAILVFTKWSFNNSDIRKRRVQGVTEENHSANWKRKCNELFHVADIPIVYVDALYDPSDSIEFNTFKIEAGKIWQAMDKMKPYDCRNVGVVKRQLDQHKDLLKEMENQLKRSQGDAEKMRQKWIEERDSINWKQVALNNIGTIVTVGRIATGAIGSALLNMEFEIPIGEVGTGPIAENWDFIKIDFDPYSMGGL